MARARSSAAAPLALELAALHLRAKELSASLDREREAAGGRRQAAGGRRGADERGKASLRVSHSNQPG